MWLFNNLQGTKCRRRLLKTVYLRKTRSVAAKIQQNPEKIREKWALALFSLILKGFETPDEESSSLRGRLDVRSRTDAAAVESWLASFPTAGVG